MSLPSAPARTPPNSIATTAAATNERRRGPVMMGSEVVDLSIRADRPQLGRAEAPLPRCIEHDRAGQPAVVARLAARELYDAVSKLVPLRLDAVGASDRE